MTLADVGVIVAGVALALTLPSRVLGWSPFLPPPLLYFAVVYGLKLAKNFGLVLALVVLFRRGRYGGPVRPAEWLALGLASLRLLDLVPDLDEAVNAYYAYFGSDSLDFGVARWLLSAPAAAGIVSVVAGLAILRRRMRDGSRLASALTAVGIAVGSSLWFWGPCEVARLQLPSLLVPAPREAPSSWGWRGPVALALREMVAHGPAALAWGLPAAVTARAWWAARFGRSRTWVWTERAAFANAVEAALLLFSSVVTQGDLDFVQQVAWVVRGVGVMRHGGSAAAAALGWEQILDQLLLAVL